MKSTYTREQLEALRDCLARKCIDCQSMVVDCVNTQRAIKGTLAADLLSALDEIERLRTALEKVSRICDGTDGPDGLCSDDPFIVMSKIARNALKDTTNER